MSSRPVPTAEARWRAALARDPLDIAAWDGLAGLASAGGRRDLARRLYRAALALVPQSAALWNNLAVLLQATGAADEAGDAFWRARRLDPGSEPLRHNARRALADLGRRTDLARLADEGDQIAALMAALAIPAIATSTDEILATRAELSAALDRLEPRLRLTNPEHEVGTPGFYLAQHGLDDRPLQERLSRFFRAVCPSLNGARVVAGAPRSRPRVGIVTALGSGHVISMLAAPLLDGMGRERLELVLIAPPGPASPQRQRMIAACAQTLALPVELDAAVTLIADAACDILLYLDIGMAPLTYYLAHLRLAPIQAMLYGHPDTTGISTIDYYLSPAVMEPADGATHYSERLIQMPGLCFAFEPDAPTPGGRRRFGLPDDRVIYALLQSRFKLHPDLDPLLVELLRRDRRALLLLVRHPSGREEGLFRARLARLDPAVLDQTVILDRQERGDYLAHLAAADVVLDTVHFSGGVTSLEALSVAAPVVTWPGRFMRGRQTLGHYRLLGWSEAEAPVAADGEGYVALAHDIAHDRDRRDDLRHRLAGAGARLGPAAIAGPVLTEYLLGLKPI